MNSSRSAVDSVGWRYNYSGRAVSSESLDSLNNILDIDTGRYRCDSEK